MAVAKQKNQIAPAEARMLAIPWGYLCGGLLVDRVFKPFLATQPAGSLAVTLFGAGKGLGIALLFLVIRVFGTLFRLPFRADQNIWKLGKQVTLFPIPGGRQTSAE